MNNLGHLSFLANGEAVSTPKQENYEVLGIGTHKFEFGTIKTQDIHKWHFEQKSEKVTKMGCFSPKSPSVDANQSFAGVGGTNCTFHNNCLCVLAKF